MADSTETVTVVRPPGKDGFGDPLPGTASEHNIDGCMFAPGKSDEASLGANTVDSDGVLYIEDPGADIVATDKVRIRGELYEVVGKPGVWAGEGTVAAVKLVTG